MPRAIDIDLTAGDPYTLAFIRLIELLTLLVESTPPERRAEVINRCLDRLERFDSRIDKIQDRLGNLTDRLTDRLPGIPK